MSATPPVTRWNPDAVIASCCPRILDPDRESACNTGTPATRKPAILRSAASRTGSADGQTDPRQPSRRVVRFRCPFNHPARPHLASGPARPAITTVAIERLTAHRKKIPVPHERPDPRGSDRFDRTQLIGRMSLSVTLWSDPTETSVVSGGGFG